MCVGGTTGVGDERGGLVELVDASRTDGHRPAERTDRQRDRPADPRRRAGDHRDARAVGGVVVSVSQSTHRR
jgi:hypothetical protein